MSFYTSPSPRASRADRPSNSAGDRHGDDFAVGKQRLVVNPHGSKHAAKAARAIVLLEFGRHGAALDQGDFVDCKPWTLRLRSGIEI